MVPAISKSNLDFFDEDNEDAPSSPPYFDINTKILDEYKISTQDKIERFFQLVKVPLNYSVDKIVSLTVRNTMTTMQHRGVLRMYRAGKPSWIARPIGKLWGATVCKMHGVLLTRGRMSKQKRLRNLWHLSDRLSYVPKACEVEPQIRKWWEDVFAAPSVEDNRTVMCGCPTGEWSCGLSIPDENPICETSSHNLLRVRSKWMVYMDSFIHSILLIIITHHGYSLLLLIY
ncbi:unnamed protein product [Lepeophtheirus salmonis]|uniref:(salmon louse) hypothetical protein n=1 Tax=Lepeophtheirus salmonis TaxID=72036 RepID=A0A7R8CJT1_LEPSM|nr:unnamed protein product [Lepeophtheirus salmonis]CAF2814738.1 unnamed protein product [Lepeophtheirus salmonis]